MSRGRARGATAGRDRHARASGAATPVDLAVGELHQAWMALERLLSAR